MKLIVGRDDIEWKAADSPFIHPINAFLLCCFVHDVEDVSVERE